MKPWRPDRLVSQFGNLHESSRIAVVLARAALYEWPEPSRIVDIKNPPSSDSAQARGTTNGKIKQKTAA
jgi:hypothetical protein